MSTSTISGDYPEMGEPVFDTEKINAQIFSIEKQVAESYNQAISDAIALIEKRALISLDDKAFHKKFDMYRYPYSAILEEIKSLIKHS